MKVRRRKPRLSRTSSRNARLTETENSRPQDQNPRFINTIVDRLTQILLSTSGPLNDENRYRSRLVGFSCLLMALPGLYYAVQGRAPIFGVGSKVVGLCSFGSDFVTASGRDFSLRQRNRAFAADLGAIYSFCCALFAQMIKHTTVCATALLFSSLALGVLVILGWSGRSCTPRQWKWRHTVWHIFITTLSVFAHNAVYPGSLPWQEHFSWERATYLPLAIFLYFCIAFLFTTVADVSWAACGKKGISWLDWWSSQRYPGRQDICRSVEL